VAVGDRVELSRKDGDAMGAAGGHPQKRMRGS
jgi:hypothetical protein